MTDRHYWVKEKINDSKVHKALFLGEDKEPLQDKVFAIKVVDCRSLADVGQRVKNEVQILQSLRNVKSIITLRDVLETELHYYLVMDYLGGGDVFDRIVRKGMYQEEEAKKLACNLLSSVDFMHHRNVCHRDLKPQNMLFETLEEDTEFQIAGFSFAKIVHTKKSLWTRCGTLSYVAPEVLKGEAYDESADLWSVGVILFAVLVGYPPFLEQDQQMLYQKICKGQFEFIEEDWSTVSEQAQDLVKMLLQVNPDQRWKASEALQKHEWVRGG